MRFVTYDVESLRNAFTCTLFEPGVSLDAYVLADGDIDGFMARADEMRQRIVDVNPHMGLGIDAVHVHDLSDPSSAMALMQALLFVPDAFCGHRLCRTFERSSSSNEREVSATSGDVPNVIQPTPLPAPLISERAFRRPVRDTDECGMGALDDGSLPYLLGFNSASYDMVMLAKAFSSWTGGYLASDGTLAASANVPFDPHLASDLRDFNNHLFELEGEVDESGRVKGMLSVIYDHDGTDLRAFYDASKRTGRNVDISRVSLDSRHMALKRIAGQLGLQILESPRLAPGQDVLESFEDLADLVAYNASDVIVTWDVFCDPNFGGKFDIKRQLLLTYPDLVYETSETPRPVSDVEGDPDDDETEESDAGSGEAGSAYRVFEDQGHIRHNRLYIDSTNTQLTSRTLCPDGRLKDDLFLGYRYPSEANAAASGRKPIDVVNDTIRFVSSMICGFRRLPDDTDESYHARQMLAARALEPIMSFYVSLRDRNFDASPMHTERLRQHYVSEGLNAGVPSDPNSVSAIQAAKDVTYAGPNDRRLHTSENHLGVVPYFDAYGRPTTCYALFSIGGIHGAEYDKARLDAEAADYVAWVEDCEFVSAHGYAGAGPVLPDDVSDEEADAAATRFAKLPKTLQATFGGIGDDPFPSGRSRRLSDFLATGYKRSAARWRRRKPPTLVRVQPNHDTAFDTRYVWTSVGTANHEDFKSYYPNLLDQMGAFENDRIDANRYHDMFLLKEEYGHQMKAVPRGSDEWRLLSVKRNGVKLQLNAASGAGDATFDNPIRVNNRILQMRVTGQLFSWRIGQAQALVGARVVSTNTDGLYTVLDQETNDRVLAEESANIGVIIEPEVLELVSKDTNNRVEWTRDPASPDGYRILSCGGGDLTHWAGPNPTKSLAHPAAVDYVLAHYLVRLARDRGQEGFAADVPFDRSVAMDVLDTLLTGDPNRALVMLGTIASASPSVYAYPFAVDHAEWSKGGPMRLAERHLRLLGHYTRYYVVRKDCGREVVDIMRAAMRKGTEPKSSALPVTDSMFVRNEILGHGYHVDDDVLSSDRRYPTVMAQPGLSVSQPVTIVNGSVREMAASEARRLLQDLDVSWYLDKVEEKFCTNWRNHASPATDASVTDPDLLGFMYLGRSL